MNSPTSTEQSSPASDTQDELFQQDAEIQSDTSQESSPSNSDDPNFKANHEGPGVDDVAYTRGPPDKKVFKHTPLPNFLVNGPLAGQEGSPPPVVVPGPEEPEADNPASNDLRDLREARVIPRLSTKRIASGTVAQGQDLLPNLLPNRPPTPPTPQAPNTN